MALPHKLLLNLSVGAVALTLGLWMGQNPQASSPAEALDADGLPPGDLDEEGVPTSAEHAAALLSVVSPASQVVVDGAVPGLPRVDGMALEAGDHVLHLVGGARFYEYQLRLPAGHTRVDIPVLGGPDRNGGAVFIHDGPLHG